MQDRTVVYSTEVFILGVLLFKKRRVDSTLLIVYQIHIRQLGVLICILERGATSIDEDRSLTCTGDTLKGNIQLNILSIYQVWLSEPYKLLCI